MHRLCLVLNKAKADMLAINDDESVYERGAREKACAQKLRHVRRYYKRAVSKRLLRATACKSALQAPHARVKKERREGGLEYTRFLAACRKGNSNKGSVICRELPL